MGITPTKKVTGVGTDSDSFLLVFFPHDHSPTPLKQQSRPHVSTSSSSSSSFRRTPSPHLLLSRAHSTLSICALFFSLTLLLFALSSLDHSPSPSLPFSILWRRKSTHLSGPQFVKLSPPVALQGMGVLHRRGSRAMPDLIVAHVSEDTSEDGLRLFLRALHRSGVTARSDVVLIFPDRSISSSFGKVIKDEDNAFLRLLDRHLRGIVPGNTSTGGSARAPSFDAARFVRKSKKDKETGEPLWGKRTRSNYSDQTGKAERRSYGSVVSFDANELDPEGTLSGFLEQVPMGLRRWSCYSMLLGRVRRNFKHVMLVDAKEWVILRDPFEGVRNRSSETVVVWGDEDEGKEVMVGGMRGVRRVGEAMETEIVKEAVRRKGGGGAGESVVVSQVGVKNVELVLSGEEEWEGLERRRKGNKLKLLWVGNSTSNSNGEINKWLCWWEADSSEIYSDC